MKKFFVEKFLLLQNHFLGNSLDEKNFVENFLLLQNHFPAHSSDEKIFGQIIFVRFNLPLFSTVVAPSIFLFLSCRPFVAITTISTGLVGVEVTSVSWLGQLTVGV
jgi:hypothetical protein